MSRGGFVALIYDLFGQGVKCRSMDDRMPIAIYVHIPFCPSKCGYCDFSSFALSGEIMARTTAAIIREIQQSRHKGRPAKTIFLGGGTPTFIPSEQLTAILAAVLEVHSPNGEIEITSEANPGTVDAEKFKQMREAGFNRLSLGAQSFHTEDLLRLGRVHGPTEIGKAVKAAREAGFENLNLDLMFALPGQTTKGWKQNLETALSLRPEHLSLYGLTIEPNTRFYRHNQRGLLDLPDDETQVQMYDDALVATGKHGYQQYEISNFSRPGRECHHNLCYWNAEEYIGYGPGAVGCIEKDNQRTRYTNMKHPDRYCEALEIGNELWCDSERVDAQMLAFERLMLGLRLNGGLQDKRTARSEQAARLVKRGWLITEGDRVTLTAEGRHFCSAVIAELA